MGGASGRRREDMEGSVNKIRGMERGGRGSGLEGDLLLKIVERSRRRDKVNR